MSGLGRPGLALVVLSVVEQRLDAVRAVLDGAEVAEVAARMGVHRATSGASPVGFTADPAGDAPQASSTVLRPDSQLPLPGYLSRSGLPYVQPGDRPADDHPLDLRRALEDREDLRVAVPALDRVLAGVAVAAEDLNRLLSHADRSLPRHQLGHRALGVLERLALAGHPGRAPGKQPRRVDRRLHVGELKGDPLVLPYRTAELNALRGIVSRELHRRAGDADGHRRH